MTRAESTLTVLLPCLDQDDSLLTAAIDSVLAQSSPDWVLLFILNPDSPQRIADLASKIADPRMRVIRASRPGLAGALNAGLDHATTDFVCFLCSDDELAPGAIETLAEHRRLHPAVDFFHSSREHIDGVGRSLARIWKSPPEVTREYFVTRGSPVKHLMSWRRDLARSIGGFDESLAAHGCDDYDFPWSMLEAGARFQPVSDILYRYRDHQAFFRLTTHVPLETQVDHLVRLFRKHRVPESRTTAFLREQLDDYLAADATGSHVDGQPPRIEILAVRGVAPGPRTLRLRCPSEDGLARAQELLGPTDPSRLYELVMIPWDRCDLDHETHPRLPSEILARATLVLGEDRVVFASWRIAREPDPALLRHLVDEALEVAAEAGLPAVLLSGEELARLFPGASMTGDGWRVEVAGSPALRDGPPVTRRFLAAPRILAFGHDVEASTCREGVEALAELEESRGIRSTWFLEHARMETLAPWLRDRGHTVATRRPRGGPGLLRRGRAMIRRMLPGVPAAAPPAERRSLPGRAGLAVPWEAVPRSPGGPARPMIAGGLVRVPLERAGSVAEWLARETSGAFTATCSPVGGGEDWLSAHARALDGLASRVVFRTLDEVADHVVLMTSE